MTCLVSFPGWSHSTARPAAWTNKHPSRRESRVILGSRHLHRKQTLHRERSAFFRWLGGIWFDILPSLGWDSLLLSAKQCSAMVEQKTKVFMAQNFSLHRSGGGEEQDTRSRLFWKKCRLQTFPSPLKVASLLVLWLQLLSPPRLNFAFPLSLIFFSESNSRLKL